MGRKPRLKHQKRCYCSSRGSKSLTLENRNMHSFMTTILKSQTELCTPKLPEPELTADSLIVSIPLQMILSQVLHVPKLSEPYIAMQLVVSVPSTNFNKPTRFRVGSLYAGVNIALGVCTLWGSFHNCRSSKQSLQKNQNNIIWFLVFVILAHMQLYCTPHQEVHQDPPLSAY